METKMKDKTPAPAPKKPEPKKVKSLADLKKIAKEKGADSMIKKAKEAY